MISRECGPLRSLTVSSAMKKIKHKIVEHMTQETADTLGLTRAVLINGETSVNLLCTSPE